jgi:mannose-6-phosphate isomerase
LIQTVHKISGVVQHYSWGGYNFIPELLGIENKEQKPYAEYWLGAHTNHPSLTSDQQPLSVLIEQYPQVLGSFAAEKYGALPFLFKVLDVRQMLSIQVHPDSASAMEAYAEENKRGIPLTAPNRNYKDENHKPELMVALSDFWLLHGFKEYESLQQTLAAIPEFLPLAKTFEKGGYVLLYREVMEMDQAKVNALLAPLIQRILPLYNNEQLEKTDANFWAARAAIGFCKDDNYDRGIFSIYFFNLLHLKEGEGIYQPAGMPHAYLEGKNVEVMANSDNVLRAGLTSKHVDVAELMKHVKFEATVPDIIAPPMSDHRVFSSPAEEFELHEYSIDEHVQRVEVASAEIWFVLDGALKAQAGDEYLELQRGEAAFFTAGTSWQLSGLRNAKLFRVVVPDVTKN